MAAETQIAALPKELQELQSGHRELFDTLGALSSDVGGFAQLPQIVVVGNQGSGKSSVLEAISGIRFPVSDGRAGRCTRMAIQLSLRRAPCAGVHVSCEVDGVFQYEPYLSKSCNFDEIDLDDITQSLEECAASKLCQYGVWDEILHVEVSGPNLCPLTLVDLPGFNTSLATKKGNAIVDRLAKRYMAQKSSIILAVVSAKDGANPKSILDRVVRHDPKGQRTFGIFTGVHRFQGEILSLAMEGNLADMLMHRWHVLRESMENEGHLSHTEREAEDDDIFSSPVWSSFPKSRKGLKSLRQRLNKALYESVRKVLPANIEKLNVHLDRQTVTLEALGPARHGSEELKNYLIRVSESFERIARDAILGNYSDVFFSSPIRPEDGDETRKMRAIVNDLNRVFYNTMMTKGQSRTITNLGNIGSSTVSPLDPPSNPKLVQPWLHRYSTSDPTKIPIEQLLKSIKERVAAKEVSMSRDSALDALAIEEFRVQSSKWRSMAICHTEVVMNMAKSFVAKLLTHVFASDQDSYRHVMALVIKPFFHARRVALRAKINELTRHYESGPLLPLEPKFAKRFETRFRNRQSGMGQEVIDKMTAYYEVGFSNLEVETVAYDADSSIDVIENIHRQCGHPCY